MKNATKKPDTPASPPASGAAETALTTTTAAAVPAVIMDEDIARMLLEDAGAGMESMTKEDLAIPRLAILQDLSPQVKSRDPKYIEGAKPGDIMDTASGQLFDGAKGLDIILVSYRRTHIEWVPQDNGGGFVADHGPNPEVFAQRAKLVGKIYVTHEEGNEILPTAEYFALILSPEGDASEALISMSKSAWNPASKLNTMTRRYTIPVQINGATQRVNAPLFYRVYHFTTVPVDNKKGQSWMSWEIEPGSPVLELPNGDNLYRKARKFKADASANKVKVQQPQSDHTDIKDAGTDFPF